MPRASYYHRNKEKCKRLSTEWANTHSERVRLKNIEWVKHHPESRKDTYAKHHSKNKEDRNAYTRLWKERNPDRVCSLFHKRRTQKTLAGGSFTSLEWKSLCEAGDNRCLCCGKRKKLTADHVIPVSKGGTSNIDNIQPLCGPCNSRKHDGTTDFRLKTQGE